MNTRSSPSWRASRLQNGSGRNANTAIRTNHQMLRRSERRHFPLHVISGLSLHPLGSAKRITKSPARNLDRPTHLTKGIPMSTFVSSRSALMAAMFLPLCAAASSHREAPSIAGQPRVDGTDFYMFRSYEHGRSGYVTFIANYIPLQDAFGG